MEAISTIRKMIAGNKIFVPNYQRAYSWITEKHVKQFLIDLNDYIDSQTKTPYYFGHFLFEKSSNADSYNIIDGQQRLTTIEIFLCAVYKQIKKYCDPTDTEFEIYEDIIKRNCTYRFSTVEYDNPFFKDCIIDQTKTNTRNIETLSAHRFIDAFDYFTKELEKVNIEQCKKYIEVVANSACTTHIVNNEAEAIQMFIFQNNRGKLPTKLEIIKAQFMYEVHISSAIDQEEKESLLKELQERFENIYKSIVMIEGNINEDDVLLYSLRVYFNSLDIDTSTDRIETELKKKANAILFIKGFAQELESCFESLKPFFQEKEIYEIYSLALLGKSLLMPFVIKAYKYNISDNDKMKLFSSIESIILRHRIIGTRAHLEDRVKDVFKNFTKDNTDCTEIIERLNWLAREVPEDQYWWEYWSNDNYKECLKGGLDHNIAKHILWKYENYLLSKGEKGYKFKLYSQIENPELEHIAPQTPTDGKPIAAGYCQYDDEFINKYLDCLGNYLLISKSHNCSIGNVPFEEKRKSYNCLKQQEEIQEMTKDNILWDKNKIAQRHEILLYFVLNKI
jgi:uncharacterized protein with ParB-like and HNH nuclease domain